MKITGIAQYSNFRIKKIDLEKPPVKSSLDEKISFYSQLIKEGNLNYLNEKLGWAYYHKKQYKEAKECFKSYDEESPSWFNSLMQASCYDFLKQFDVALQYYKEAFDRSRNNQHALRTTNNFYAYFLSTCADERKRQPQKALKLSIESLKGKLSPGSKSQYMSTLACGYAASGNFDKAIETIDKILLVEKDKEKKLIKKKELIKQEILLSIIMMSENFSGNIILTRVSFVRQICKKSYT